MGLITNLASLEPDSSRLAVHARKLPGDLAMWVFILVELTVFALFFIGFAVAEQQNLAMFTQGKAALHPVAGVVNTLALITSSLFVALSLNAVEKNLPKYSAAYLLLALLAAVVYVLIKIGEYQLLFSAGIDIETNTFFTLYFLITCFHLMHVLLGMCILAFIALKTLKGAYKETQSGFESGAAYWHMVDLLWIILFPLIYII
jgi:nitric oxide reductase NorE protein